MLYACTVPGCNKSYSWKKSLNRHKRAAHPGRSLRSQMLKCPFYKKKGFKGRPDNLEIHKRICKNNPNQSEKRFICNTCSKRFPYLSILQRHQLSHQFRNCSKCHKRYSRSSLLVHEAKCTGIAASRELASKLNHRIITRLKRAVTQQENETGKKLFSTEVRQLLIDILEENEQNDQTLLNHLKRYSHKARKNAAFIKKLCHDNDIQLRSNLFIAFFLRLVLFYFLCVKI